MFSIFYLLIILWYLVDVFHVLPAECSLVFGGCSLCSTCSFFSGIWSIVSMFYLLNVLWYLLGVLYVPPPKCSLVFIGCVLYVLPADCSLIFGGCSLFSILTRNDDIRLRDKRGGVEAHVRGVHSEIQYFAQCQQAYI
jgi:hypothetical protein